MSDEADDLASDLEALADRPLGAPALDAEAFGRIVLDAEARSRPDAELLSDVRRVAPGRPDLERDILAILSG